MSGRRSRTATRERSRSPARGRSRGRNRSRGRRKSKCLPEVGDLVDVRIRPNEEWRRACVSGVQRYKKKKTRVQCMLCDGDGRANPQDKVSIPFEPQRLRRARVSLSQSSLSLDSSLGPPSPTSSIASFASYSSFASHDSRSTVASEDRNSRRARSTSRDRRARKRHVRAQTDVIIREDKTEPDLSWQEVDPLKWMKSHVATWVLSLKDLGIPSVALTHYATSLEWRGVSGRMLFKLTEVELRDKFHIVEPEHVQILLKQIREKNPKRKKARHNRAQTAPEKLDWKKEGPREIGRNEDFKSEDYGIVLDDGRSFLEPKLRDYRAATKHHMIKVQSTPIQRRPTVDEVGTNNEYPDSPYGDGVLDVGNTLKERLYYRDSATDMFEARKKENPVPHRESVNQIGRNVHFQEPDYEVKDGDVNTVFEQRINYEATTAAFEARKRANPLPRNPTVRNIGVNGEYQEPDYELKEHGDALAERINYQDSTAAFLDRKRSNPVLPKLTVGQIGTKVNYQGPDYVLPDETGDEPFPDRLTYADASTAKFEERKKLSPLQKRPTVRDIGINEDFEPAPYDEAKLQGIDTTAPKLMFRASSRKNFEKRREDNPVPHHPLVSEIGVNADVTVPYKDEMADDSESEVFAEKLFYRSSSTRSFEARRAAHPVERRLTVDSIGRNEDFEEPSYDISEREENGPFPEKLMFAASSTEAFENRKAMAPLERNATVKEIGTMQDFEEPEYAEEVLENLENMETLRERLPIRIEIDRHAAWVQNLKRSNVQLPKELATPPNGFYTYVKWLDALREFAKEAEVDESLWHTRELDEMTALMKEEIELHQAEHGKEYLPKFRLDKRMFSSVGLDDLIVQEKVVSLPRANTDRSDTSELWSDDDLSEDDALSTSTASARSTSSSRSVDAPGGRSLSTLRSASSFSQLLPDGSKVVKRVQIPRSKSYRMKVPYRRVDQRS